MTTTKRSLTALTTITLLTLVGLFAASAAAGESCISADYLLPEPAAVVEVAERAPDGTFLGDGAAQLVTQEGNPVPLGAQLDGAVLTNVGSNALEVSFSTGAVTLLQKNESVAVGISNERICVCRCKCSAFETVDIRCDSNSQNCADLNGSECERKDGSTSTLSDCKKIYVKAS